MKELNAWFDRAEFKCRCCDFDTVDHELLVVLTEMRIHFGSPVIITGGCRCEKRNKEVGGVPNSKHLVGQAADVAVVGTKPSEIYEYLCNRYKNNYGIGIYPSWTHIDVAKYRRW